MAPHEAPKQTVSLVSMGTTPDLKASTEKLCTLLRRAPT